MSLSRRTSRTTPPTCEGGGRLRQRSRSSLQSDADTEGTGKSQATQDTLLKTLYFKVLDLGRDPRLDLAQTPQLGGLRAGLQGAGRSGCQQAQGQRQEGEKEVKKHCTQSHLLKIVSTKMIRFST